MENTENTTVTPQDSTTVPATSVPTPIVSQSQPDSGWFTVLTSPVQEKTPETVKPEAAQKAAPEKTELKAEEKIADKAPEKTAKPETEEKLEKRLKDTRDALTQERQRNLQLNQAVEALSKKMEILTAKVDGTYEEKQETPDPAHIAAQADFVARIESSNEAAIELVMVQDKLSREDAEKKVSELIWDADSPYLALEKSDPVVKDRVAKAKAPVIEAMKVLKEKEIADKFGKTPEAIKAALEKQLRDEITAQVTKEVTEKIKAELKAKPGYVPLAGVGDAPGSGKIDSQPAQGDNFSSLFPMFPKKF